MKRSCPLLVLGLLIIAMCITGPTVASQQGGSPDATPTAAVEMIAIDLDSPRGLTWAPDGSLVLALAGTGGSTQVGSTSFYGGATSSIVTVEEGCTSVIAEDFPSAYWESRRWVWGVMDIAYLGGELYVLHGGGPQGWGLPETPVGIYRVTGDGRRELVADLATWFKDHPPANVPGDYDSNGSVFDMEAGDDRLWLTESNGGRVLTVDAAGTIDLIADLSGEQLTPTGLALDGEGGAYVGFVTVIPYQDGTSKVVYVDADGTVRDHWTGLTAVNDLVMGPDGSLYAAEMATGNLDEPPFLTPDSGRIVRQVGPDELEVVTTDIPYPVSMGFDAQGALYVAGPAFSTDGRGEGQGWLVRTDLIDTPISLAGVGDREPTCSGD